MLNNRTYSQIVEKDGISYLFDANAYSGLCLRVDELQPVYDEIKALLQRHNYPDAEEWIRAIATGGADSVAELMLRENDKEAKRLKVPAFIARQWRKSVIEDAPKDFFDDANSLRARISSVVDGGVMVTEDDITYSGGRIVVNADAIKERMKPGTMYPISDQLRNEAQELRGIIVKLRTLQEGGLWVLDVAKSLMGNWLSPSKYPDLNDDLAIYSQLMQMRHNSRETIKSQSPEWYYLNGGE